MKNKVLGVLTCGLAIGLTIALGAPLNAVRFVLQCCSSLLIGLHNLLGSLQRQIYRRSVGPLMNLAERLSK